MAFFVIDVVLDESIEIVSEESSLFSDYNLLCQIKNSEFKKIKCSMNID